MRVKFTVKRPLSSVVATCLKSGISPHVVVTVTPGIGRRSGSTTLPISLPCLAEASPGTVKIKASSHAILRCSVVIVITFPAASPGTRERPFAGASISRERIDARRPWALESL